MCRHHVDISIVAKLEYIRVLLFALLKLHLKSGFSREVINYLLFTTIKSRDHTRLCTYPFLQCPLQHIEVQAGKMGDRRNLFAGTEAILAAPD